VTTYSRSRTIARKSVDALRRIKEAVWTGSTWGSNRDMILSELVKKGVTAAHQIEAGQKAMAAGLELSEYVMPGLGGQALWKEHATATAQVLNQINPHFIRIRSLRIPDRVPLSALVKEGSFRMQSDDMLAEELKLSFRPSQA